MAGGPVRIRVSPEGFCRLKKRSKGDSARDRRLIEEWLPIAELSVEGPRERTPMTPFPAPNRLHVWWARRPLVASRAAVLGSLLPAGADREKFLHLLGIHGDPVAARQAIDRAKQSGKRIKNPYDYDRAFKYCPTHEERRWLEQNGMRNWRSIRVLDPTAGGGSIPFETHRSGLVTLGNDLNPVAALIADATVTWPAQFPRELADEFEALASDWRQRIGAEKPLEDGLFLQAGLPDIVDVTYLHAHTVRHSSSPAPTASASFPSPPTGGWPPTAPVSDSGLALPLARVLRTASLHLPDR